jgi:hypothetical protein
MHTPRLHDNNIQFDGHLPVSLVRLPRGRRISTATCIPSLPTRRTPQSRKTLWVSSYFQLSSMRWNIERGAFENMKIGIRVLLYLMAIA